jgi:GntR family transcriptional regulator
MIKIYVNPYDSKPLYRQIVGEIKDIIASGKLKEGEKLPTVRELALSLSVNPNTVARAYRELEREGFIETFTGKGTFVSRKVSARVSGKLEQLIRAVIIESRRNGITIENLCKKIKERSEEL